MGEKRLTLIEEIDVALKAVWSELPGVRDRLERYYDKWNKIRNASKEELKALINIKSEDEN